MLILTIQLKSERENSNKEDEKKTAAQTEKSKKNTLDDLKPQRSGVGKYLSASLM